MTDCPERRIPTPFRWPLNGFATDASPRYALVDSGVSAAVVSRLKPLSAGDVCADTVTGRVSRSDCHSRYDSADAVTPPVDVPPQPGPIPFGRTRFRVPATATGWSSRSLIGGDGPVFPARDTRDEPLSRHIQR